MTEINRILAALDSAAGQPATLATLVRVEGSSYRRPGARLLVLPEGKRIGSISGGCLDEDVLERADRVLRTGEAELATYNTAEENDLLWGVGTGCDGTVSILLEYIPAERPLWLTELRANQRARRETMIQVRYGGHDSRGTQLSARGATVEPDVFQETVLASPALLICGAGDDAQPLVRMAKETGWHVTVADTRPAYANAQRFPDADRILSGAIDETMAQLKIDSRTFAVVMTHRFEDDWKFLGALLSTDIRHVGQLGARKRTERLLERLDAQGFGRIRTKLARLYAPVGLDLGGSSPETVALAILAEMQARLSGRMGGNLRDRVGPIHD